MYDMNDAEPQRQSELIPDGTFAKIALKIRPGGVDGASDVDAGLLKAAKNNDVLYIDCEFTVTDGPHANRKFWQAFTVSGGKLDDNGVSIGWKISKSVFRSMIDSALGLDPSDMSDAARSRRVLRGLSDLNGITFVGKIKIEPSMDIRYSDQNKLDLVILPNEAEWGLVMSGKEVPPAPGRRIARNSPPAAQAPAWGQRRAASAPAPAWANPSGIATTAKAAPVPPVAAAAQAAPAKGPAWLNS
jgi:hypothetical protein